MIACLDVHYAEETVVAAAVVFADWRATAPLSEYAAAVRGVGQQYEAGRFSNSSEEDPRGTSVAAVRGWLAGGGFAIGRFRDPPA